MTLATWARSWVNHRWFGMALSMVTWRVGSMALGFINSIWITRHLGAYKLGISGMVNANLAQAGLVVMLGMDALLIRKYKNLPDAEARTLVRAAMAYRLFATCVLTVASLPFAVGYGLRHADWPLGLALTYPLLLCMALTPTWLLSALERQPALYRSNFWGGLVSLLCNLALVRHGSPAGADLVAQLVCAAVILIANCRAAGLSTRDLFSFGDLKQAWCLVVESRWLAAMGCVIYLYISFEVPLLGYLTSLAELGRYRTAVNITVAIQSVLAIVPTLLYPRCVEWAKAGPAYLWQRQKHLALGLSVAALPGIVVLFAIMPTVFRLCYGAAFVAAAVPATILVTSKMVVLINGIFGAGLLAQARDRDMLCLTTGIACLSVLLNLAAIPRWGMVAAASVNLLSETCMLAGCLYLCHRRVRVVAAGGGG